MRVLVLTPPGRLPTVVHDPGLWWDAVAENGQAELLRFSANFAWWRSICSSRIKELVLEPLGTLDRLHRRAEWRARNIALSVDADAAGRSLDSLTTARPFQSADSYLAALAPIARYLADFARAQAEFNVTIGAGPHVRGLDYADSASLVAASGKGGLLARSIEAALADCPGGLDVIAVSATSPEDLLTALIACRVLRGCNPGVHISLIDHGYENFSLHPHIDGLRTAHTLDQVFDTIIASKDDRDDLVPALIEAVKCGRAPRGYVTRRNFSAIAPKPCAKMHPPAPIPTFTPEPILWTRLSKRRCYWGRCTYCTQNTKYESSRAPVRSEILQALDRIEACVAQGYRYFYFSDEALSPSTLRLLADEIERRHLTFQWACRCKLEKTHTAELFARLGNAGCYEILYGLETTSARVQKLMDKHVEEIDECRTSEVLRAMESAGIGVHVNLIGGYPGDTLAETERSVEFVIEELAGLQGGTYILNEFAMFADAPVSNSPERYGIASVTAKGDIAQDYDYELMPEIADCTGDVHDAIPRLRRRLDDALGWSALAEGPEGAFAMELYFGSGHGSIFKARPDNPFANPLRMSGRVRPLVAARA
jgi:hypothetical protein